jgi:hypothetical protein
MAIDDPKQGQSSKSPIPSMQPGAEADTRPSLASAATRVCGLKPASLATPEPNQIS